MYRCCGDIPRSGSTSLSLGMSGESVRDERCRIAAKVRSVRACLCVFGLEFFSWRELSVD